MSVKVRHTLMAVIALVTLVSLSGCSSDELLAQLQTAPLIEPETVTAADVASSNRLLVIDRTGNLITVDPDGSDRLALTEDASASLQYLQPTWSPDAQQIAWTEVNSADGVQQIKLVAASFNGEDRAEADVPFAPFYIYWSPTSDKLAYLSNWTRFNVPSMALRLAELADTETEPMLKVRTLAEGSPFYFSWNPLGDRLITHTDNTRLQVQSLDGLRQDLAESSGDFPAPHWTREGEKLVYAVNENGLQRLIVSDTEGTVEQELTDFASRIAFSVSPDSQQLAYVVTDAAVSMAALGPLYVVDMDTTATREVTDRPAVAFFWSPDGTKLAYMTVENGTEGLRFRWSVWDGTSSRDYGAYLPSRVFFQNYLAFFDQYAQSMNLWSPDSTAFAYPGIRNRLSGIWVQNLDDDRPRWIGQGEFVAWSPR